MERDYFFSKAQKQCLVCKNDCLIFVVDCLSKTCQMLQLQYLPEGGSGNMFFEKKLAVDRFYRLTLCHLFKSVHK